MQPWDAKPGMTFGAYGINFERTQTWWENGGKAWCDYLTRCQAMLISGLFIADVLHYIGDDAPNFLGFREDIWNPIPAGYDYDGCNLEILQRLEVTTDGRLVLPHGMSYRLLLLPEREHMTLNALRKIEKLVRDGATIVGPRPIRTPGLTDYQQNDETLRALAKKIWGKINGKTITENKYGKGRVIYGPSLDEILPQMLPPDFDYSSEQGNEILRYIHRKAGDADFYFVANGNETKAVEAFVRFRVVGKAPELWDPSTRTVIKPAIYSEKDGITEMPLRLDPAGSVFVVFREPTGPHAISSVSRNTELLFPPDWNRLNEEKLPGSAIAPPSFSPLLHFISESGLRVDHGEPGEYHLTSATGKASVLTIPVAGNAVVIQGPWDVVFPSGRQTIERLTLPKLICWTESENDSVKYFSGTATYTTTFEWSKPRSEKEAIWLDLGEVKNIAEVKLNGVDFGVFWKTPYAVNVSRAIETGTNELEIRITNLWPNRLIGDEKLYPDPSLHYAPAPRNIDWTVGGAVRSIPEWVKSNGSCPIIGRTTFVAYQFYGPDSPLLPSGLLGPVKLYLKFIGQ